MIVLKGRRDRVDCVRFTRDGAGVVTASRVVGVQVWASWAAGGGPGRVVPLAGWMHLDVLAGGRLLVGAAAHPAWLAVVDPATGGVEQVRPDPPPRLLGASAVAPDGSWFALAQGSPCARYWLVRRNAAAPHESVWGVPGGQPVAVLPDGRCVTVESPPGAGPRCVVRRGSDGAVVSEHPVPPWFRHGATASADGTLLAGFARTEVDVYRTGDLSAPPVVLANDGPKHFTGLAFHPSGDFLAATSTDRTVKVYDARTWQVARAFDWAVGGLRSVAFSPDGSVCAAGGDNGQVVVWDFDP